MAESTVPSSPPPSNYRRWQRIGVIAAAVLLIAIIWVLWARHSSVAAAASARRNAANAAIAITAVTASRGDIDVYLNAIGTVTPVYTASITSQVSGRIVAVHYKESQPLHKGDPLIDIDDRPYRATLLQAQGTLERDQNVLAQAKMDLARYQAAVARNAIAQQIVDDQAKLVDQDEGTVKNDQGTVQYDEVQVAFCHITAPFDGQVGLRLVDPGNVVQAGGTTALAVMTQLQPITVVFTISEDELSQVAQRLRAKATLAVDAFDRAAQTKLATGKLIALDNQIDTSTGTVKARASFDNTDNALFPNQFVNTRLLVNTLHDVTLVPSTAVQQNGTTSFVYVIQNDVAHQRTVKVGVTNAGMMQVTGINPGDVVADSSFEKLQDGAKISVATPPAARTGVATTSSP